MTLHAPVGDALRSLWRELLAAPEPCLREAAWHNEVIVAQVRLLLLSLVCAVPIVQLWLRQGELEASFGLLLVLTAMVLGVAMHAAARHNKARTMLPLLSSLVDVTFVSLGLGFFLAIEQPLVATNSFIIFPLYFLALATSSLRYDPRICLLAGGIAAGEYLVIVKLAVRMGVADAGRMSEQAVAYGRFDIFGQAMRVFVVLAVAFVAAVSVVRARELLARSARDPLTSLFNRRTFVELVRLELVRCRCQGSGLALALLDLDFFKHINDTHGHQVGDRVLEWFGSTVQESFRESDVVARLGGDEFAVLLVGSTPGRAAARLEQLRSSLESRAIPGTPYVSITVSAGLAFHPDDGESVEMLLQVADSRLYEAKEAGRNRIILASGPRTAVMSLDTAAETSC